MNQHSGDVLLIQSDKGKAEVFEGIAGDECLRLVSERAPELSTRMQVANARLAAIQKEVIIDPDEAVNYYRLQAAQAQADERFNLDLEGLTNEDAVTQIDSYHRYTSIGSALLYQHANFEGSTKFFTVTWPNMNWWPYRFNDRASSAKAWGANILFEHSWYRGRRLYLIGLPFVQFNNLTVFGFNDVASSFASIG